MEKEDEADDKRRHRERKDVGEREWRNEEEERKRQEEEDEAQWTVVVAKFTTVCRECDGHSLPLARILRNLLHQGNGLPLCGRWAATKSHLDFFEFFS